MHFSSSAIWLFCFVLFRCYSFLFFFFFRCVILAAFCFVAAAASKNILFILCVCTVAAVLCVPAPSTVPHWLFPSFTYFSFYFFFSLFLCWSIYVCLCFQFAYKSFSFILLGNRRHCCPRSVYLSLPPSLSLLCEARFSALSIQLQTLLLLLFRSLSSKIKFLWL